MKTLQEIVSVLKGMHTGQTVDIGTYIVECVSPGCDVYIMTSDGYFTTNEYTRGCLAQVIYNAQRI